MSRRVLTLIVAWSLILAVSPWATSGMAWAQQPYLTKEIFADLARRSAGAVVNISTERTIKTNFGNQPQELRRFFERFLGHLPRTYNIHSLGSGIIIDSEGYVVTNNHVVEKAQEIKITRSP